MVSRSVSYSRHRPRARSGERGRWFAPLITGAGALAAVYAVAVGLGQGRALDATGRSYRLLPTVSPTGHEVAATVLESINVVSLAVIVVTTVAMAWLRRGLAAGVLFGGAIVGAGVTAEALKFALGRVDPFGWEALRGHFGTFPSGHATIATVVVMLAVFATAPRCRITVAALGGVFLGAVSVSVVLLGWHFPSDAVGGWVVGMTWSAMAWRVGAGPAKMRREP